MSAGAASIVAALAPLHDIGKVGISDAVLNKPGKLTGDEFVEMRTHPAPGHQSLVQAERLSAVRDNEVLALAKQIAYTHHERWDGTGYTRGLRGTEIPLPSRNTRFDPDLVDAFLTCHDQMRRLSGTVRRHRRSVSRGRYGQHSKHGAS